MLISSRNNPTVKKILSLQEKKYRALYGEYIVEGKKSVAECIAAGKAVTLVVRANAAADFETGTLPVLDVTDDVFSKISSEKAPQGVLCLVRIPEKRVSPPTGNALLLDGIADAGNLGTIIRTANAAGYEDIYLLCCADPYSPKTVRASMSGVFHTRLHVGSAEEIFSALAGLPLVAADLDGENIFDFTPPAPFCLCIGNEGHGLSEETKARRKYVVTIPMRSTQESLNAGVSAGIAMYVLKRAQREAAKR